MAILSSACRSIMVMRRILLRKRKRSDSPATSNKKIKLTPFTSFLAVSTNNSACNKKMRLTAPFTSVLAVSTKPSPTNLLEPRYRPYGNILCSGQKAGMVVDGDDIAIARASQEHDRTAVVRAIQEHGRRHPTVDFDPMDVDSDDTVVVQASKEQGRTTAVREDGHRHREYVDCNLRIQGRTPEYIQEHVQNLRTFPLQEIDP